jgi:hypothetical protein
MSLTFDYFRETRHDITNKIHSEMSQLHGKPAELHAEPEYCLILLSPKHGHTTPQSAGYELCCYLTLRSSG